MISNDEPKKEKMKVAHAIIAILRVARVSRSLSAVTLAKEEAYALSQRIVLPTHTPLREHLLCDCLNAIFWSSGGKVLNTRVAEEYRTAQYEKKINGDQ